MQFALTEIGYNYRQNSTAKGIDNPSKPCLKSELILQPTYSTNVAFTDEANSKQE